MGKDMEARARSWKILHPMRGRTLLELECVWCPGEGRDQAGEEMEGMGLGWTSAHFEYSTCARHWTKSFRDIYLNE